MRGESEQQLGFSLVRPDLLVPEDHPIRTIKMLADAELRRLSSLFDQMYSRMGCPSIPPEHLDGTLMEAWASLKSFKPKGDDDPDPPEGGSNPTSDFHGERRSNDTYSSKPTFASPCWVLDPC